MGRASPIQNSFNAGELSPLIYSRVDLAKRQNGVQLMQNWVPTVQGPVIRRPGSVYVAEVKDSTKATRVIPFEFSTEQAYILEFGDQYVRFYRDHAQIISGTPVEISSPYLETELFDIAYVQSADVVYLAHPNHEPRKLSRTSHTAWTLTEIDFLDGPYLPTNTTATTLTPSVTTGTGTLTASSTTGINGGDGFQTTDVGRLVRIKHAGDWGYAEITGHTSTTLVDIEVKSDFTATTATATWRLGVWSDTTGFPQSVAFFEDRLWWGGGKEYSQRIDGSRTGDYENMASTELDGTVADDNAVGFTLNSSNVNAIQWMVDDEKGLIVGTTGGEWIVRPSDQSEALTPTNIKASQSTRFGGKPIVPVRGDNAVLFVQRAARKLREIAYVFEADGFRAPDMTVMSEHITESGIKQLAFQREPQPIVWAVRTDGVLLGMTYEREQDVVGWHQHVFGGYGNAGQTTEAVVESVAVIPTPDATAEELWVVVNRYIDGGLVRYVEYLSPFWDTETAQEDALFLDSNLTYDSVPTTTITGLGHLEGQSVAILADGATHPNKTVASGSITLDREASVVQIGLEYNSDLQLLSIEAGSSDGTAQGKKKRSHRVIVRVYETLGLSMGRDANNLHLHKQMGRSASDDLGEFVPLKSVDLEEVWDAFYDNHSYIYLRLSQPFPGTIQAVMPHVFTQNRQ